MRLAALILIASAFCLMSGVVMSYRDNQVFAVWTNTPPRFLISTSSNLVDWTPWLRKESGKSFLLLEFDLQAADELRFYRFEELP